MPFLILDLNRRRWLIDAVLSQVGVVTLCSIVSGSAVFGKSPVSRRKGCTTLSIPLPSMISQLCFQRHYPVLDVAWIPLPIFCLHLSVDFLELAGDRYLSFLRSALPILGRLKLILD